MLTTERVPTSRTDGVDVRQQAELLHSSASRCDVIASTFGDNDLAAKLAAKWGKPDIRLVHGDPTPSHPAERLTRHGGPALAVFNSESLRDRFAYTGPSVVARPVLHPEQYRTIPGRRLTLVNLTANKGAATFDQLARYMPSRSFLGVQGGYGTQMDIMRDNVDIVGPTSDMLAVYARTRILLMPSKSETWGMVAAEAMCSGIPVIASPTPGIQECCGHAAFYADRDDLDSWMDLIELLDDPEIYAEAASNAARRATRLAYATADDAERFVDAVELLV